MGGLGGLFPLSERSPAPGGHMHEFVVRMLRPPHLSTPSTNVKLHASRIVRLLFEGGVYSKKYGSCYVEDMSM